MIGIMNCGSDSSVEFYASNRQSSLYQRKPSKDTRTYTPEGRVLINGKPEVPETPDDLWRSLICRAITTRVMKDPNSPKESGPLAVIRRFSSRLGIRSNRGSVEKETMEKNDENDNDTGTGENNENGGGENGENGGDVEKKDNHVTIIKVKTMNRKKEDDGDEQKEERSGDESDQEEFRIYAHDSILKRLMEEKAMIEKEMGDVGDIEMEWAKDKSRVSVNEDHDMIIERL